MKSTNPYASPAEVDWEVVANPNQDFWRDDKSLIVRRDAVLPKRCVLCGEPTPLVMPLEVTNVRLLWRPLVAIGMTVGESSVWGEKFTVNLGICQEHERKERRRETIRQIANVGSVVLMIGPIAAFPFYIGLPLAILSFILAIIASIYTKKPLSSKVVDSLVRIKGASPNFLKHLPAWTSGK